ncbi:MAG: protoheme IX farnesyltransferase [Gammaproteobacteria bacterium]|nr:protoheme IX farnesyltransferase [Gammaproteobacteria bacterium]MYD76513.1 protoheme IX farnesyltransferase [Gammaproteobacteria bacterium]MYJ51918.1 protoheme IX farnesyltransferase [Gammaproteobacteria bacterium]
MTTAIQAAFPWRDYLDLCKPKVVMLILFTALVGMFLSTEGAVPFRAWFWGLIGIGLAASAGAALNHWVDEEIDARMERTRQRPLPQGQVRGSQAVIFALILVTLSMAVLLAFVNVLTAVLTLASMVGYAIIYSMFLKRTTPQNIVLGGAAGAAPPVLGWTAVTGELHSEALLLFLIIFVWTPPHFWALAIKRVDDYANADVPMLPVTHGVALTKLHVLLYTVLLVVVTLIPFLVLMSGTIYLAGALALGAGFVFYSLKLYTTEGDGYAMKTFGYSIFYLSALFVFLLLDHYARILIRAFFLDS